MAKTQIKATSTASTNATSVVAGQPSLQTLELTNTTATAAFFKLYDKASAPTVGTDSPVVTIPVPANSNVSHEYPDGLPFANGLAYAVTGAITDADTTSSVAGVKILGEYLI